MSAAKSAREKEPLVSRLSSFLFDLAKPNWFVAMASISTVAVFCSFVVMTMQALWWNYADVLLPMKVAIPVGYAALLGHMLFQISRYVRNKDIGSASIAAVEFIVFAGSLLALQADIIGFYGRGVFIGLGEGILPFEVRVIVTLAFLLPLVFVILAGYALVMLIVVRFLLESLSKVLKAHDK